MFDMEADRIRDLAFDPEDDRVRAGRGVFRAPHVGGQQQRRHALANWRRPRRSKRIPITGRWWAGRPTSKSWTMDDLKSHWSMGYAPNNCVMVIVGDVKFDSVMALSKKFLEPIPRREPPPPVRTKEPRAAGRAARDAEQAGAIADPDGALSHARSARSRHAGAAT